MEQVDVFLEHLEISDSLRLPGLMRARLWV
jgi:hypothetical protein